MRWKKNFLATLRTIILLLCMYTPFGLITLIVLDKGEVKL